MNSGLSVYSANDEERYSQIVNTNFMMKEQEPEPEEPEDIQGDIQVEQKEHMDD